MTFTKTRPTTPGFFIWKEEQGGFHSLADAYTTERGLLACIMNGSIRFAEDYDGEWCRLVPVEEIQKAWDEAMFEGDAIENGEQQYDRAWPESRAKRVMEGKE